MPNGFWAISTTEPSKRISAFICPLGHFYMARMPFGLKKALFIYQRCLDYCLWGMVCIPPEEEAKVDQEVLQFLDIDAAEDRAEVKANGVDTERTFRLGKTVFQDGRVAPSNLSSALGRSSYIDDIARGTASCEELCETLIYETLLFHRLLYWRISVSLLNREFGKDSIHYLSHKMGTEVSQYSRISFLS